MRVFIDYCINNPVLTVILIISTVAMLIASGFMLALPNTEKSNDENPLSTEEIPAKSEENNDVEKKHESEEKKEQLIDDKLFHELPIRAMNDLKAAAEEDDGFVDYDYEYEDEEPTAHSFIPLDIPEEIQQKDKDENTTENTANENTTKVVVKEKKSKSTTAPKSKKAEPTKTSAKIEKTEETSENAPKIKAVKNASEKKKKAQKPLKTDTPSAIKEPTMLLDELKDVNNEIDFYEEDETDRMARYKGKWIICRVVTEERSASNIKSDEDEMYFFELHASNGEKLLSSEEVYSYNSVLRGIETHKTNILRGNFKIAVSKNGEYFFKLLSGKNLLLCMGENYATQAACESAIESTKRFAKTAIIDENIQDHVVKVPQEDNLDPLPLPDECIGKWIISERKGIDEEPLYYFELFAANGEKLLSSEEYTTYIGAVNGIHTHKSNIEAGNFSVTLTKRGDYLYKLLNRNGQLLCLGEHYRTKRRCLTAVEAVKRYAKQSPVLTSVKNKL